MTEIHRQQAMETICGGDLVFWKNKLIFAAII
jgi:hypothetical protein